MEPLPLRIKESLQENLLQVASRSFQDHALYECLAQTSFRRDEVLQILAQSSSPKTALYLLLGAVQFLLMREETSATKTSDALKRVYMQFDRHEIVPPNTPDLFSDFCKEKFEEVSKLVKSRRVQTNDPARSIPLVRSLTAAERKCGSREWDLYELGASAGLNLTWTNAPLMLAGLPSSLPFKIGRPHFRFPSDRRIVVDPHFNIRRVIGVDINPLCAGDSKDVLWLRSLIWPGQPFRLCRLRSAMKQTCTEPPEVVQDDLRSGFQKVFSDSPQRQPIVLFHSFFYHHLSVEDKEYIEHQIVDLSKNRLLVRISLEFGIPLSDEEYESYLSLLIYEDESLSFSKSIRCNPHIFRVQEEQ